MVEFVQMNTKNLEYLQFIAYKCIPHKITRQNKSQKWTIGEINYQQKQIHRLSNNFNIWQKTSK